MKRVVTVVVVWVLLMQWVPLIAAGQEEIRLPAEVQQQKIDAALRRTSDLYNVRVLIEAVDCPAREYISGQIAPELSDGDCCKTIPRFAELCEDFLKQDALGTPYTESTLHSPSLPGRYVWGAIGVGCVIALIAVLCMKRQLKSVAPKASAADYVRKGSLNVYSSKDVFLYSRVTSRTRSNGGGGASGGGRSRGNHSGGRF